MIYIINGLVKFNPADGTLWNIDNPEHVISLTITNSYLLQFILESNGSVLSREKILTDVWDKQGLRLSNNTLNQYISISRRSISLLGIEDDVIITVPRTGFRLNEYALIVKEGERKEVSSLSSVQKVNKKKLINTGLAAFLVIMLIIILYPLFYNDENSMGNIFYVGRYQVCDVYVINSSLHKQNNDDVLVSVQQLIRENATECVSGKLYLAELDFRGRGREFLAECTRNAKGNKHSFCKGYYIK